MSEEKYTDVKYHPLIEGILATLGFLVFLMMVYFYWVIPVIVIIKSVS